jgi:hypothetical protein
MMSPVGPEPNNALAACMSASRRRADQARGSFLIWIRPFLGLIHVNKTEADFRFYAETHTGGSVPWQTKQTRLKHFKP